MDTKLPNHSEGSSMVQVMKELYLDPRPHLDFSYGYPESLNPDWIRRLQSHLPEEVFQGETSGIQFIRKIEEYFSNLFHTSDITITSTAGYAIAFMCDAVIRNPNDEIILQDVSFEPYPKLIESYKGKPVVVPRDANFALNVKNIKNAITDRTKAIIIVNPDNPVGLIYNEDDLNALVALCIENNLTLVVDYTFFQISPFGDPVPLVTTFPESKQLSYILIGDTGKILGLKGSKFGALLYSGNWKELISDVLSNYFFQYDHYTLYLISTILADRRFNDYLHSLNAAIAENYLYIKQHLHPNLRLLPLQATVFCLIDIEAAGLTDDSLSRSLLDKGIGVIPISDFYYDQKDSPRNIVRVSLSRPLPEIRKFVEVINQYCGVEK